MILTPPQIQSRLKSLGIRPDKYLGQHFLIDQSVLDTIWEESQKFVSPDGFIIEAGPGLGILTHDLLNHEGVDIIAIEKDPVFARALPGMLQATDRVTVIKGDILDELDTNEQIKTSRNGWYFISNIPYAITSPLIRKLLYHQNPPRYILILVQKELAERIAAQPGDRRRGLLTIQVEVKAETKIIRTIPPDSFWPPPEVESALLLISLRPQGKIPSDEQKDFFRVVTAGFSSKRKQLQNSLSGGLGLPPNEVREFLQQCKIDPTRRAETLTLNEWSSLTTSIQGR